jgi:hypothetical protein
MSETTTGPAPPVRDYLTIAITSYGRIPVQESPTQSGLRTDLVSSALECTTAILRNDVDSFLAGVSIKLDKKGEIPDVLYGRRRRRHANLVVDIGYRPDLGDVLQFDAVMTQAKLARHMCALCGDCRRAANSRSNCRSTTA